MNLKILTLHWNNQERIQRLADSLLPILPEKSTWLIRDNGSKDKSVEQIIKWKDDRIRLYQFSHNRDNYSQGNNWLFEKSESHLEDYILLLNNDVVFRDKMSIHNMIQIMDNDSEVGIVGCKLNYEDRTNIIQHAGVLYHPSNVGTPFHFRAGKVEEDRDRRNRYYPMVTGACLLIRASLFEKVGGLNDKLQWSWDDSFLCLAVGNLGKKIVYCGQTNITHAESVSLKSNPVNKLFFDQNLSIFMDKWKLQVDKSLVSLYENNLDYAVYKQ